MKKKALTGHDNFCYLTSSLVEYDIAKVSSYMTLDYLSTRDM